ncbi:glycosyltransferase [Ciceribacter ferrooxidans]|uniref:Chitooligosaccharide deacetylase n=1 Tax=Ciceribacter ferrooxidans TaxID=2509717 RepID=A0A4V1RT96_9HYPH|nr:glycosyltransferase [Ciceribacter ferrooxidans]RYC23710.1 glycosyltransferase [Ciceribacter ferrooxidans]
MSSKPSPPEPGSKNGRRKKKKNPVFYDPTAKRGIALEIVGSLLVLGAIVWFVSFGLGIYLLGKLPVPEIGGRGLAFADQRTPAAPGSRPAAVGVPQPSPGTSPATPRKALVPEQIYGYLPYWSAWGDRALDEHLTDLDGLMPEWYQIALPSGELTPLGFSSAHQVRIADVIARRRWALTLLPVVDLFDPAEIARALASPEKVEQIRSALVREVAAKAYDGICLNIASVPDTSYKDLGWLLAGLRQSFAAIGRQTCIVVASYQSPWTDATIAASVDRYVVLAFEEPADSARPMPLAPQAWFADLLSSLAAQIPPEKLVVALGNFSYDWVSGDNVPREMSFAEASRLAGLYRSGIRVDPVSLNSTTRFVDGDGDRHRIWLLDAVSFHNQLVALSELGRMPAVAIWPFPDADPGVWRLLDGPSARRPVQSLLKNVPLAGYVGYDGKGAFHKLVRAPENGLRDVVLDPATGLITAETYERAAEPFSVLRYGAGERGMVALTFDDGPDPRFTNAILDELATLDAPGAFFVIGRQALENTGVVHRIVDAGHEIGVHTYSHPMLERSSEWRSRFELNITERLIASLTGRQTLLFRSPYGNSEGPLTGAEAEPLRLLDQQGYIVVGADIVPPDWLRISADEIVASVLRDIKAGSGNVIVLHDGGGNREATVKAIPILVNTLRREGYRFVSLAEMLGLPEEVIMPHDRRADATFDAISFDIIRYQSRAFYWLFWISIVAGITRAVFVIVASQLRTPHPLRVADYAPPVTVLIPAYCEEESILDTVAAVLASDYPDLKVVVIDDGSTDDTCVRLLEAYGRNSRVLITRQANHGKYAALNHAYTHVDTDIVVAIDADTQIAPDAIRKIVRHFRDPAIGAVAGNVKVRNRDRLLARMQALEYLTSQNVDRRASEVINGMLVVPGALGAWRRKAVEDADYYSSETFAEDADLTVSVIRAGYKVVYEEGAVARTVAPTSLDRFLHQRLRWLFGMMQTGWKHRSAVFEMKGIGLISITDLLLFGVLTTTMAPLIDAGLVWVIADRIVTLYFDPSAPWSEASLFVIAAYTIFAMSDLMVGLLPFYFETKEDKRLILLLPLQRVFYRQLLYFSTYRAIALALTGRLMRWRKATDTAAVGSAAMRLAPRVVAATKAGDPPPSGRRRPPDNHG